MKLALQNIHLFTTLGSSFPWWEIGLSASNLLLASIVGWSSWRASKKNRSVHLADKRKEWLREFRDKVAELMALMGAIDWDEKDYFFQRDLPSKLTQDTIDVERAKLLLAGLENRKGELKRYRAVLNELMLLMFEDGEDEE